jgi:hypothetical protein
MQWFNCSELDLLLQQVTELFVFDLLVEELYLELVTLALSHWPRSCTATVALLNEQAVLHLEDAQLLAKVADGSSLCEHRLSSPTIELM